MLETSYKQWSPLLFFITQRFGVPPEVGDEIVQEAFLRLVKQDALDPVAHRAFLITTTRHLLIDERKKQRPQPVAEADVAPPAWESGRGTIGEGRLSLVGDIWEQLKPQQDFAVFADYYQSGWTTEEIAKRRRLPAGTVRSKIHRLREKFRQLLDRA